MLINIKNELKEVVLDILSKKGVSDYEVVVEKPKDRKLGDLAIPVFTLAKTFRKAPNLIAEEIAAEIKHDIIDNIQVMGGYINIFLNREKIATSILNTVFSDDSNFPNIKEGNDKTVIVEYSSPNIAKPFHIGHIRTTIIGASLYNIYEKCGYDTVGINHLGDYGTQFGKLIVAIKNWGDLETIEKDPIPELLKLYVHFHKEAEDKPELEDEARNWFTKLEHGDEEAYKLWSWIREVSLLEFNRVYNMLGIKFDSYAGESFYSDKMDNILKLMREKNVLQKDDGAEIVNLEEYNLPNALITKKDGSTLYITRDLAAAMYRKEHYNFHKNIYVVGHQQELHFKQWIKIFDLMGYEWAKDCVHVPFGMVSLKDGSLSTRRGRVVFLEDVLKKAVEKAKEIIDEKSKELENKEEIAEQVGIGAVVFQELFHNRRKDYEFSWEKTLSFEGETGPYLQYTYVRINSLLEKASKALDTNIAVNIELNNFMWNIIFNLLEFEETITRAKDNYDPSEIAKYLIDVAQDFNKFYANEKVFTENEEETTFKLQLAKATNIILKEGLRLLCIKTPEKM